MTWHRPATVRTPDQQARHDAERAADEDPGDRRLRGTTRRQQDRASALQTDLDQTHLSEYREDHCKLRDGETPDESHAAINAALLADLQESEGDR